MKRRRRRLTWTPIRSSLTVETKIAEEHWDECTPETLWLQHLFPWSFLHGGNNRANRQSRRLCSTYSMGILDFFFRFTRSDVSLFTFRDVCIFDGSVTGEDQPYDGPNNTKTTWMRAEHLSLVDLEFVTENYRVGRRSMPNQSEIGTGLRLSRKTSRRGLRPSVKRSCPSTVLRKSSCYNSVNRNEARNLTCTLQREQRCSLVSRCPRCPERKDCWPKTTLSKRSSFSFNEKIMWRSTRTCNTSTIDSSANYRCPRGSLLMPTWAAPAITRSMMTSDGWKLAKIGIAMVAADETNISSARKRLAPIWPTAHEEIIWVAAYPQ